MKLTNKYNLPEPFVIACRQKTYDNQGSWRSVTELISPPKISHLKRVHDDEITEDVVDRVYTLQGEIAHGVVEKAAKEMAKEGWISEQRMFKEVLGKKISGQFDLFNPNTGELIDVKNSTAWKAKKGRAPEEWINQCNLLASLVRLEGFSVNRIGVVLIIRDFSKLEAKRDEFYPEQPVVYLPCPVWDQKQAVEYLERRVQLHLEAETKDPECSPEERWAKPTIWAIKKRGGIKAIPGGLYSNETMARTELLKLGNGYELEYRPGQNVRCENYCAAAPWCEQFKLLKKN